MRIRDLRPAEHDAAIALWHEAALTRPWNDPRADLDRALAGPSSTVLAAVPDGGDGLLGTVMVGHDGHRGWMYYLAAAPRGEGTGRALVAAAEAWLSAHVPKVQLMVRGGNPDASDFYAHLGYERSDVSVWQRVVGPGRPATPSPGLLGSQE
ncbi:GNAT family acetyltransferase [Actinomycetospora sp. OC33-EN08]|uniref:GNAT family acetyltransferase n=1 Tax=Actinomycetospora aurantiaca TaxID=3129233 RepID=A0ABU8MJ89_9PSEU